MKRLIFFLCIVIYTGISYAGTPGYHYWDGNNYVTGSMQISTGAQFKIGNFYLNFNPDSLWVENPFGTWKSRLDKIIAGGSSFTYISSLPHAPIFDSVTIPHNGNLYVAATGELTGINAAQLQGYAASYFQTKTLSNADSTRLKHVTDNYRTGTAGIADSVRINFLYTDTAVTWNDTVKLTKNKVFAMETLTGSKTMVQGTATLTGVTYEYWFKGTGNAYTITWPAAWKKIGTDVYDDVLNNYYTVTVHKGSSGIICYVINKLP